AATGKDGGSGPEADAPEPDPDPVTPCDPNPCTGQASICAEDGTVTSYTDGECTVINDDDHLCAYTEASTACSDDQVCLNGACLVPGDPADYEFSADASAITSLGLAEDDPSTADIDEGDCCFDYNGDGKADNGLGSLLQSLVGFLGDSLPEGGVNGLIQEQIDNGDIAIVFEQVGLDDATNDAEVRVNGFFGEAAGDGSYLVDPASFIEGTKEPTIAFTNGAIEDGVLTGGPALFSVTIPLGEFGFDIALDSQEALVQVDVTAGADGTGLDLANGILGGVVPLYQLADALNGLSNTCDCLGLNGAGMLQLEAEDKLACTQEMKDAVPACNEDDDGSLCVGIGDNKGIVCTAIGILKPDIDTDLSGKKDSFSLGLRFAGEATTISGLVTGDVDPPPAVCDSYCAAVGANCTDDNAITWTVDCATDCATWPEGADGDQGNNTTHCRLYHAGAAADDAALHCPHASPDGGGVCIDSDE
ncbi:MAG: hypothetical protein QF464_14375, partial [Myxococcota bacterium]|nr:hypothetical protein [Myxococcota bacterium]